MLSVSKNIRSGLLAAGKLVLAVYLLSFGKKQKAFILEAYSSGATCYSICLT